MPFEELLESGLQWSQALSKQGRIQPNREAVG